MPIVSFALVVGGGSGSDPGGRDGLMGVVADMVDEGTGDLGAIEVSEALANIGGDYDVEVGADAVVFTLTTLARFLDRGADLFARHDHAAQPARGRFRARAAAAARSAPPAEGRAVGGGRARVPAAGLRQPSLRPPVDWRRAVAGGVVARRRWWRPTGRAFRPANATLVVAGGLPVRRAAARRPSAPSARWQAHRVQPLTPERPISRPAGARRAAGARARARARRSRSCASAGWPRAATPPTTRRWS